MSARLITLTASAFLAMVPLFGATAADAAPAAGASARTTVLSAKESRSGSTPKSTPKVNPPMLRVGATGPMVSSLQKKLGALGYWVGSPSARYDHTTAQGVMALQKAAGLGRDGVVGPATWRALDRGTKLKARSTTGRVLEIDLARQLLLLVKDGKVSAVINTSTGTAATPTPRGSYRVIRQIDRWHTAPLGKLYRPKYFYRGYAVHGVADGSIPGRPASHGCARVSTKAMDMLWGKSGVRVGDRVLVY